MFLVSAPLAPGGTEERHRTRHPSWESRIALYGVRPALPLAFEMVVRGRDSSLSVGRSPTRTAASGRWSTATAGYMDLHLMDPACGVGLHRHRDNSGAFLVLDGEGWMVIGDWADTGRRPRCFEVRLLRSGHLALLKGGNLHGPVNPGAGRAALFMFGGYD